MRTKRTKLTHHHALATTPPAPKLVALPLRIRWRALELEHHTSGFGSYFCRDGELTATATFTAGIWTAAIQVGGALGMGFGTSHREALDDASVDLEAVATRARAYLQTTIETVRYLRTTHERHHR